ncbi:hypothetical protein Q3A68_05755 [Mucilaginibacter sp. BT774]|nr:hypothetical protein [Mucilaginibacter sp. BT774]
MMFDIDKYYKGLLETIDDARNFKDLNLYIAQFPKGVPKKYTPNILH